MTRIIGGDDGGRRIKTPPGEATRPTSDRVREALFSFLEARYGVLDRLGFLDLYAGSGAIGLEAASRGASWVVGVEADRRTAEVARANAASLDSDVEIVAQTVATFLAQPAWTAVDVVYLDPPYPLSDEAVAADLALLVGNGWLAEEALVIVERSRRSPEPTWPAGLEPLPGKRRQKKYGETVLWLAEAAAGPTDSLAP